MDVIEALFMHMFKGIESRCATELAVLGGQYPFPPLRYAPTRLTFDEGIALLRANGYPTVRREGRGRRGGWGSGGEGGGGGAGGGGGVFLLLVFVFRSPARTRTLAPFSQTLDPTPQTPPP